MSDKKVGDSLAKSQGKPNVGTVGITRVPIARAAVSGVGLMSAALSQKPSSQTRRPAADTGGASRKPADVPLEPDKAPDGGAAVEIAPIRPLPMLQKRPTRDSVALFGPSLAALLASPASLQEDGGGASGADVAAASEAQAKVVFTRGPVAKNPNVSARPALLASPVAGSLLGVSVNQQDATRAAGQEYFGHHWSQIHNACRSWLGVVPHSSGPLLGSFAAKPMAVRGSGRGEPPVKTFVKTVLKRLCSVKEGMAFAVPFFPATKEKGIAPRQIVGEADELNGIVSPLLRGIPISVIPPSEAGPIFNGFRNTQAICSGASPVLMTLLEWVPPWEELKKDPSTKKTVRVAHEGSMMKVVRWAFVDGDCRITDRNNAKSKGEVYLMLSTGGCYYTPGMLKPASGVGNCTFWTPVHTLVANKDVHHLPLHGPIEHESHENKTIDGHQYNSGYSIVLYDAQALDQYLLRVVGVTAISRTVVTLFVQQIVVLAPRFKEVYPSPEELDEFAKLPGEQSRIFTPENRYCAYKVKDMKSEPFRAILQEASKTVKEGLRTTDGTTQLQSGVSKDGDKNPETLYKMADDLLEDLIGLTLLQTRKGKVPEKFKSHDRWMTSAAKTRRKDICEEVEREVIDSLSDPLTDDQVAAINEAKECIVDQHALPSRLRSIAKAFSKNAAAPPTKGGDGVDEEAEDGDDGADDEADESDDGDEDLGEGRRVDDDGDYEDDPVEDDPVEDEDDSVEDEDDSVEGEEADSGDDEEEDSESDSATTRSTSSSDCDEGDPRKYKLDDVASSSSSNENSDEESEEESEDEDSSSDDDFVAHENVTEDLTNHRVKTRAQKAASGKTQRKADATPAVEDDDEGGKARPAKVNSEVAQLQSPSFHDESTEEKVSEDTRTYNDKLHAQVALSAQATQEKETRRIKKHKLDVETWERMFRTLDDKDRERFIEVSAGDLASAFSLSIAINAGKVKVAGGNSVKIPIYNQYVCYLTCKQEQFVTSEVATYKAVLESFDSTRLEALKEEDKGIVRTTCFMSIALQLVLPVLAQLDEAIDEVNEARKAEAKAKSKVGDKRKRPKSPTDPEPISYPFFRSFQDSVLGMTEKDESSKLVKQVAGWDQDRVPPGVIPQFVWVVCQKRVADWTSPPCEEDAGAESSA